MTEQRMWHAILWNCAAEPFGDAIMGDVGLIPGGESYFCQTDQVNERPSGGIPYGCAAPNCLSFICALSRMASRRAGGSLVSFANNSIAFLAFCRASSF